VWVGRDLLRTDGLQAGSSEGQYLEEEEEEEGGAEGVVGVVHLLLQGCQER